MALADEEKLQRRRVPACTGSLLAAFACNAAAVVHAVIVPPSSATHN
jgi:hypothetical protein